MENKHLVPSEWNKFAKEEEKHCHHNKQFIYVEAGKIKVSVGCGMEDRSKWKEKKKALLGYKAISVNDFIKLSPNNKYENNMIGEIWRSVSILLKSFAVGVSRSTTMARGKLIQHNLDEKAISFTLIWILFFTQ